MKYECRMCPKPCRIETCEPRRQTPTACLFYYKTAQWCEIPDKPAPHVVTKEPQVKDDEIVKAFEEQFGEGLTGAKKIARTIEAKIDLVFNLNQHRCEEIETEIEAVRNNLGELTQTVCKHSRQFACLEESQLGRDLVSVERKVEELEKSYRSHLLEDHKNLIIRSSDHNAIIDRKPQPKGGVARATRCKDSRGTLHDLKVQQSVVSSVSHKTMLFLGTDKDGEVIVFVPDGEHDFTSGRYGYNTWAYQSSELTWIRDLSFPGGDQ